MNFKILIDTRYSSNIDTIYADQDNLVIGFKQGTFYKYENIPDDLLLEIKELSGKSGASFSWGKWFAAKIRKTHDGKKMDEKEIEDFKELINGMPDKDYLGVSYED